MGGTFATGWSGRPGGGERVGLALHGSRGARVLVDLLHRVEVYGVGAPHRRQVHLVLPRLVRSLNIRNYEFGTL